MRFFCDCMCENENFSKKQKFFSKKCDQMGFFYDCMFERGESCAEIRLFEVFFEDSKNKIFYKEVIL